LSRRDVLKRLAGLGGGALATALGLSASSIAAGSDYKVLVCLYMRGGADGNDILIPVDGAYQDYASVRGSLALPKDSLIPLAASGASHAFAFPSSMRELVPLYNQGRMVMVANVGALVKPITAAQVLNKTAVTPPFLFGHAEQAQFVQGWLGDADQSGWAGRSMEQLPSALRGQLPVLAYTPDYTLVLGKASGVTQTASSNASNWGTVSLASMTDPYAGFINALAAQQSQNAYEAEYARSLGSAFHDAVTLNLAAAKAAPPAGNFPNSQLGADLANVASLLPVFRAKGIRRQVILVEISSFDTHAGQRGDGLNALDGLLADVSKSLAAFDNANIAAGLDQSVVTLGMSEFGRTFKPGSGSGTDHGWGSHWFVVGGPVQGKQVVGTFPSLVLGGPDDCDSAKSGRWVPTLSADHVGATLMQWMGLPVDQLTQAFPNLANFTIRTLPFLHS
jgi:uncharacterized protein (DUF1501 family)